MMVGADESAANQREIDVVSTHLTAACTVSEICPGEWLALGSVRDTANMTRIPACVIVGQGRSQNAALTQLEQELRDFARMSETFETEGSI